jgi:hypothetical protein
VAETTKLLIEADLNDAAGAAEACRGADYVLHQAAIPSVPRSVANPLESNRANVDGTLSLLVAARDAKVHGVFLPRVRTGDGGVEVLQCLRAAPGSNVAVFRRAGEIHLQACSGVSSPPSTAMASKAVTPLSSKT